MHLIIIIKKPENCGQREVSPQGAILLFKIFWNSVFIWIFETNSYLIKKETFKSKSEALFFSMSTKVLFFYSIPFQN